MIIADSNNEVGFALSDIWEDFKGSVVVEEGEGEYTILAGIVVTDPSDVWLRKDKCRASWRVFVNSCHVAADGRWIVRNSVNFDGL